jgi:hypothetical protein
MLLGDIVSGLSYDPMNAHEPWTEFTFDISSSAITGGSYRQYGLQPLQEQIPKKAQSSKLWWRFW